MPPFLFTCLVNNTDELAKAIQKAGSADDLIKAINKAGGIDEFLDAAKAVDNVEDAAKTADNVEDAAKTADNVEDAAKTADDAAEVTQQSQSISEQISKVKKIIKEAGVKFELKYSDDELMAIIQKGKSLGLDNKTIEDLIFVGSRGGEKSRTFSALMTEMNNYVKVVMKNGHPYKFKNLEHFNDFKLNLKSKLKASGIPIDDIRIQGSSLRTPDANDVDIAVFVDESVFDDILINRYSNKIKLKDDTVIDIKSMSKGELDELANDIFKDMDPRVKYNSESRTFCNAYQQRMFNSKSDIYKPLKKAKKELVKIHGKDIQIDAISIMTQSSNFNLKPVMEVK